MSTEIADFAPVMAALVTGIVTSIGLLVVNRFNKRQFEQSKLQFEQSKLQFEHSKDEADRQRMQKQTEDERKEIYRKLNSFYGPFEQLSQESETFHRIFKQGKPEGYRTLIALLRGEEFAGNDRILLNHILEINNQRMDLIYRQSGLISDRALKDKLAEANVHFTLIKAAYDGELSGIDETELARLEKHTYPLDLLPMIREGMLILNQRLEALNQEVIGTSATVTRPAEKKHVSASW